MYVSLYICMDIYIYTHTYMHRQRQWFVGVKIYILRVSIVLTVFALTGLTTSHILVAVGTTVTPDPRAHTFCHRQHIAVHNSGVLSSYCVQKYQCYNVQTRRGYTPVCAITSSKAHAFLQIYSKKKVTNHFYFSL